MFIVVMNFMFKVVIRNFYDLFLKQYLLNTWGLL